ncbi:hypothetical protein RISW2_11115 [Roseivivax isoporae LMG 25204]|uniref:Hemolysin activation/secretion protein n=2 Tax=Roseivivax TaxID=93682 RepID=X7F6Z4_9RHOB|nr:hypothetical protein RISW2_11115 [Roseivivax isoporae LMG 25204]
MAVLVGLAVALPPGAVHAQSASEITPDSFLPPLQNLDGAVVFPGGAATEAPPGSESIGIALSGVRLEDARPELAAANRAFEARLTRGRIPVSELFEATGDLERTYAEAGYVLTRVVLPEQEVRDGGTLRVVVVQGLVERIDSTGVAGPVRGRIERVTEPLLEDAAVTLRDLERQLLLAGDTAGVVLGTALATGERPGGTVLALDTQFRPVTGFFGFDNYGSDELGGEALSFGLELNSPFGLGETFYGRFTTSVEEAFSDEPRQRVAAIGALVPLGGSGLALNLEMTRSVTHPDDPVAPTSSEFERQSLRLIYPFIRSRQLNVTGQLILDHQTDEQDFAETGVPIYRDDFTVLRAGGSLTYLHEKGAVTEAGLILSRGIDAFGARRASDATLAEPLSRSGADAVFTKLSGSVFHERALAERVNLSIAGRFQTSFGDPLLTSEQFSIVGESELSAFDSGELRGDSGWVLRSELSTDVPLQAGRRTLVLSPYLFAAAGRVSIERPTAVEEKSVSGRAYGLGLDISIPAESRYRSNFVRIEFGKGERDDGGNDDTRFGVSGTFRF